MQKPAEYKVADHKRQCPLCEITDELALQEAAATNGGYDMFMDLFPTETR